MYDLFEATNHRELDPDSRPDAELIAQLEETRFFEQDEEARYCAYQGLCSFTCRVKRNAWGVYQPVEGTETGCRAELVNPRPQE
jgi:hypothetical protein